ncbi:MAG: hypothetical protein GX043_05070 [Desulfovibrionales bacterium]|nr:hypothetical protein [Desulfovibrionales bacterium]
MKRKFFSFTLTLFLFFGQCLANEIPEFPKNFEYPWYLEYEDKWRVRNSVDANLVLDFPSNAVVKYCAGNTIRLTSEYAGNRGNVTFEIILDEESEIGVRYEIREIQILCD